MLLSATLLFMMLGIPAQTLSPGTVWDGVYTQAQAARGKTQYEASCVKCHGADLMGGVGKQLKGEVFMRDWTGEDLNQFFGRIKNMPPGAPSSLSETAYLEILTYILQANEFPSGMEELKADALKGIRVEGKDGPDAVPNYALVQVVGCLSQATDSSWILNNGGTVTRTKDPEPSKGEELRKAEGQNSGTQTFKLLYIYPDPAPYKGHRLEVKGLLIKVPNDDRINVTSIQSLSPNCK